MENTENNRDLKWYLNQASDIQLSIFSHYVEMLKIMANQLLEDEVKSKTGERYDRDKPEQGRYSRWGSNPGSIRIGEEKVPIRVPRIYDNQTNRTESPQNYNNLQADLPSEELMRKVLLGISQSDYESVVKQGSESFGLSQSSVSRAFIEQTSKALEEFENRDLGYYDFIALVIDGKHLAKDQMIIALGITSNGVKIPIGLIQSVSESKRAVIGLLNNLIARNFRFEEGILAIADGSKAISSALKEVLGGYVIIQRCQWHKRENIVSCLNESRAHEFRGKLQAAYDNPDYEGARSALLEILNELEELNHTSANSLREGMEQTLTIHKLGFATMGSSFTTSNTIENVNRLINKHIGRVKNWKNPNMKMRWMTAALLQIQRKLRRVNNYDKLHLLRQAIKTELNLPQQMIA
jgi:transposase-like protein